MGIEIVVMGFAVASAFFGLLGPVVIWATYTSVANRRIVRELEAAEGVSNVVAVDGADASAPARLSLDVGGRQVQLDAIVRGGMHLWHVRMDRCGPGATYAVVDQSWTKVAKSARSLPADGAGQPAALRLFCAPSDRDQAHRDLARPYVATMLEAQSRANLRLLQAVSNPDDFFFELTRNEMRSAEAVTVLRRCVRMADALEGRGAIQRLLPPKAEETKAGTTESGTPVGVSSRAFSGL